MVEQQVKDLVICSIALFDFIRKGNQINTKTYLLLLAI